MGDKNTVAIDAEADDELQTVIDNINLLATEKKTLASRAIKNEVARIREENPEAFDDV